MEEVEVKSGEEDEVRMDEFSNYIWKMEAAATHFRVTAVSLTFPRDERHTLSCIYTNYSYRISVPQDILYTKRGKLYIYGETLLDKGTGTKKWKERGTGDVRLLRHRENGAIRLLMRQEKTLEVIANFNIQHEIVLTPHGGSDRAWVWNCFDFASGEQLEETPTTAAVVVPVMARVVSVLWVPISLSASPRN